MKFIYLFIIFLNPAFANKNLKVHSHGEAEVKIVVDPAEKMIQIEMEIPSESLIGHEHKIVNEQEQQDFSIVKRTWEGQIQDIFVFDKKISCQMNQSKLEIEYEDEKDKKAKHHSMHSEIKAMASWKCSQLAPSLLKVKLAEVFNNLKLSKDHKINKVEYEVIPFQKTPYSKDSNQVTLELEI